MTAKVFLARFRSGDGNRLERFRTLVERAGVAGFVEKDDLVALKTHVGEEGNDTHMDADYIGVVAGIVKGKSGKPFATDTSVLYRSMRSNAVDHLNLAAQHGFTMEKMGCPFIIGDGLRGREERTVRIEGKHYQDVPLASVVFDSDSIIVLSHFTGHIAAGFGAAIKNLGMGFSSRKGKLNQHSGVSPFVNAKKCRVCGLCVDNCPEGAVILEEKTAKIISEKCIGCGECLAVCRSGAVSFQWSTESAELQERIAEHALGVQKAKAGKIAYVNILCKMTGGCDCMGYKQKPVCEDIGALASFDPIALDKASCDLFLQASGKRIESHGQGELDGLIQMEYGAAIGLGSLAYEIEEVQG